MGTNGNSISVDETKSHKISGPSKAESNQGLWKRIKCSRRNTIAWALFSEYSEKSTLHGVKYLGEKKIHWAERIFWILTFILSGIGSLKYIMEVSQFDNMISLQKSLFLFFKDLFKTATESSVCNI